jgi:hypothetical protein
LDDGLSHSVLLTIRNIDGPRVLTGFAITGDEPIDFAVRGRDCLGTELEHDETCTVQVKFTPSVGGPRTARLQIFVNPFGGRSLVLTGNLGPTLPPDTPTFSGVEPPVQEETPAVTEEDDQVVTE